jgi:hypothetical protein
METVPFDSGRWAWDEAPPAAAEYRGRRCFRLSGRGVVTDLELRDGTIELELAVEPERGFHGVTWRVQADDAFESFFVRPHQAGNPDAVQYTPVFNGIPAWQLYHGPGFWAPIAFPLGEWFAIRVVFAGTRAEVYVGDLDEPGLVIRELKRGPEAGRVGLFASGPAIHVARFSVGDDAVLRPAEPDPVPPVPGVVPAWSVSDAFAEDELAGATSLDPAFVAARTWTRLDAEPTGLADLARVNGIVDGRNTVLARAAIRSPRAQAARLDFGFSDRALVFLNGRALYRGDDAYRSRDYRFLGSIGWYDALYLPLEEGDNDLVVAVSEDLGGWGVQARLADGVDGVVAALGPR